MAIPRELRARKGDLILPKWLALLLFIEKTNRVIRGRGVRVQSLPSGGLIISAEDNFNPWESPFKVRVSGKFVTVREGLVNGVMPAIGEIRLDGSKGEGEAEAKPKLEIENPGQARSFIAIKMLFGGDLAAFDPEDPLALQIVHIPESALSPLFSQGGAVVNGDNSTLYPLALLKWSEESEVASHVFQITHHNLNHRFVAGSPREGKPSRHLFWAA